jgi:polar amino acid transport system ATP-binding protein
MKALNEVDVETTAFPVKRPMVVAAGVWKSFGAHQVLKGVDLVAHRGQVTCIMGPSGSGKSTFLRCINHLERIDAGDLLVDGERIGYTLKDGRLYERSPQALRRLRAEIGMVFQSFHLFPHLTVLGNIIEGPIRVKRVPKAEALERAKQLLARVGLSEKGSAYPAHLSGGQQQRVAIARALAMEPKLLLFDEPTSALDPELVGEVLAVMRDLAADGMTMVVVTHEMSFARDVADQIIVMDDGLVVEAGTPRQVMGSPQSGRALSFFSRVRESAGLGSHDEIAEAWKSQERGGILS